jgi:hypothetical protein
MEYKHRACLLPIIGLETRGSFPVESPVNKRRAHAQKGLIPLFKKPVKVSSRSLAQHVQTTQSFVTYYCTHGKQQLSVVVLDKH